MSARVRIGELLVNARLLDREQLDQALEQQRAQGAGGRRLGQLLVDMGFVSEVQLTKVLSQQLTVPWVSLHHIDFSRQLLNLVPREIAEEFCLVPVYVRHERKVGDTLYLAMEDPTHDDALRRVTAACDMPVKAMIAAPSDIRSAIRAYYASGTSDRPAPADDRTARVDRAGLSTRPAPPPAPPPPSVIAPAPVTAARVEVRATSVQVESGLDEDVDVDLDDDAEPPAPAPAPAPVFRPGKAIRRTPRDPNAPSPSDPPATKTGGPAMLSLTLLDGTTLQIPSQKSRAGSRPDPSSTEDRLTTRDLVAALRAVADGAERAETLGDATWETLLAALLSLLLKKQLIADWEFVDEWQRH